MRNFILISLFAIGAIVGGIFHYKKNKDDVVLENVEKVTQDETVTDAIIDEKVSTVVAPVIVEENVIKKSSKKKNNITKSGKSKIKKAKKTNWNKNKKEKKISRFSVKSSVYVGAGYSDYNTTSAINEYIITSLFSNTVESYNHSNNVKRYSPIIGFDVNLYFRLIKNLQLFAGLDAMTRNLGAATYEYSKNSFSPIHSKVFSSLNFTFTEYLRLSTKFGARMNVCKNLAIEPYVLGGINISSMNYAVDYGSYVTSGRLSGGNKINIGRVFGSGANFILKDRYIIGVEYYNTVNKISIHNNILPLSLKIHNIFVKFGIQF